MTDRQTTLLFTLEFPPQVGGVATYYDNLVQHWPDGELYVLTSVRNKQPQQAGNVIRFTIRHWLLSTWPLYRTIQRLNITTVLVGQVLPLGTVAWLLSRIVHFDYIVILHGMELGTVQKYPRKRWLVKRILCNARHIVAANSYVAEMARKYVAAERITIVNPGVSEMKNAKREMQNELKKKYELEGKNILLQVGRLVMRKGVDKVLEALSEVIKECPDVVYVVVGSGPEEEKLKVKSKKLKVDNGVIFISGATNEEVNAWYELCDVFIMPAREKDGDFEGFGIVYLEANLHGKPVIAGDSGGVRDAVVDGMNGLLVDPTDIGAIARVIITLCKDETLRKKLGEQGRERAREFSWEKQTEKIRQVISKKLESKKWEL